MRRYHHQNSPDLAVRFPDRESRNLARPIRAAGVPTLRVTPCRRPPRMVSVPGRCAFRIATSWRSLVCKSHLGLQLLVVLVLGLLWSEATHGVIRGEDGKSPPPPLQATVDAEERALLRQLEKPVRFELLTPEELAEAVTTRTRARLIALKHRVQYFEWMQGQGFAEARTENVLSARVDYATALVESAKTPHERIQALQTTVDALRRLEAGVVALRDIGAQGGSLDRVWAIQAVRLTWEAKLAEETLSQKRLQKAP